MIAIRVTFRTKDSLVSSLVYLYFSNHDVSRSLASAGQEIVESGHASDSYNDARLFTADMFVECTTVSR